MSSTPVTERRLPSWLPLAAIALALSCLAAEPPPPVSAPTAPASLTDPALALAQELLPDVVARVGAWPVSRDLVWPRIQRKVERTLAADGAVPEPLLRFLARPVVNAIIDEHLLGPRAAAAGFPPDLDRAKAHLNDLLRLPATRTQFEAFLQEDGIVPERYIKELALRTAITDWVRRTFVAAQDAAPEETRRLYESRRQELVALETLRLERILVPAASGVENRKQAQERAALLRQLVAAGTRFADAPAALPAAPGAPGTGAVWEARRVSPKELPPEIRAALEHLEGGQISPVVELPDALALVLWKDRLPGRQLPFAEVESGLRENVKEDKGRALFRTYLNDLRQEAKVEIYPPLEDRASTWPGLPESPAPPLP